MGADISDYDRWAGNRARGKLLGDHFERRSRAAANRNSHTCSSEGLRDTASNAATRGRNKSGLPAEIEIHRVPPIYVGLLCFDTPGTNSAVGSVGPNGQ